MNIEDYEFYASDLEWASYSDDHLELRTFEGATCVEFMLIKDDVIAMAKHFKLTLEDIKD